MKAIIIILSCLIFNFAQAELTAEETKVNQSLINMLSKCSTVDLSELAVQNNGIKINAAGTKLLFMLLPNNPFMDNSGPELTKVVKINKSGVCSVRDANWLDANMSGKRISFADAWLFQCQKQIEKVSSKGIKVGDISKASTKRKGDTEIHTLNYNLLNEGGQVVGQLSSVFKRADLDPMVADYFPEPISIGCSLK